MPKGGADPVKFCGAKKRRQEDTCRRGAGWGTDHPGWGRCKLHGGSAPSGRAAAKRAAAEHAVVTYGLAVEIDPHEALEQELWRTQGHVQYLGWLVSDLEQRDLKQYQHTDDGGMIERPAIWVELYQRERKHLTEVAKTCINVGIEERRVRVIESLGSEIAEFGRRLAARLGHDPADPAVREAFRAELSVIHGDRAG